MRRIGFAQNRLALDVAVAGIGRVGRGFTQPDQQVGMRRITWHGLREIEQRPVPPVIGAGPTLHFGDGWGREMADGGIERQVHG